MRDETQKISLLDADQWQRLQARSDKMLAPVFSCLDQVKDPEIPALSIWDMGILRGISFSDDNNGIDVVITPTYSGCPAMDMITSDIKVVLQRDGYSNVSVKTQLSPAWTSDWLSDDARQRLSQQGIAAPLLSEDGVQLQCPFCGATDNHLISEFGSTACKALYQCDACLEPFDYFKNF